MRGGGGGGGVGRWREGKGFAAKHQRAWRPRWAAQLPGRELLVTQTVAYLLLTLLAAPAAPAARVKRLFALREALRLVDLAHPSAAALRGALAKCAMAPPVLACVEVRAGSQAPSLSAAGGGRGKQPKQRVLGGRAGRASAS